jgi:hypothetical protein
MKTPSLAALTLTLLVATAAGGQVLLPGQALPIERPAGAPADAGEAVRRLHARHSVSVVMIDDRASAFLIPVAGSVGGANGTFFRSDLVIGNYRAATQQVGIAWLAAGQDNTHSGLQYFSIPANTTVAQDDFVTQTLHRSGLGAIIVFGLDSLGNNDSLARLDGFSRIWTFQPGSSGSVSQNLDAVSVTDSLGSLTAFIVGLKQSNDYRSNVGIVNLDSIAHTWTVRAVGTGVTSLITVPPLSFAQGTLNAGSAAIGANVAVTLTSDGFGFWWSAYGSSVDNRTGDGWISRAKQ